MSASVVNGHLSEEGEKKFFYGNVWFKIKEVITVEPLIASYIAAGAFCTTAVNTLEFEKSCRADMQYNDTICEAILTSQHENFTEQNEAVQIVIANMHAWQQPVQNIVPIILILFLGSFSDRHKIRKPFLLAPIFGEFFAIIGCILSVIYMREWPLKVQGILQTVVPSFFGGQSMIVMAVFSYIADVSTLEMRTLRMGIIQVVIGATYPIILTLSATFFEELGYIGSLTIGGCIYLFGFLYGVFFIKEGKTSDEVDMPREKMILDIFNPTHAIETFSLLFVEKPGRKRAYVIAIMIVSFLSLGADGGEISVFLLYLQQYLSWTTVDFTYYLTTNTVIHLIGTAVGVFVFTRVFKMNDYNIINISFLDKVISNIFMAFANTTILFYVATVVSIITGVDNVSIRSLATKIVSENDFAKIQSLFGVFEALGQAAATPVYNAIYTETYSSFPGLYFILSAGLILVCIATILTMQFGDKCFKTKPNDVNEMQLGVSNKAYNYDGDIKHASKNNETTHI